MFILHLRLDFLMTTFANYNPIILVNYIANVLSSKKPGVNFTNDLHTATTIVDPKV